MPFLALREITHVNDYGKCGPYWSEIGYGIESNLKMDTKKIMCVVGTRPEAIKMAPVILALKKEPWAEVRVLATAQHRHMLDQVLNFFGIDPDIDLDIMRPNQALTTLTARLLLDLDDVLGAEKPDVVLVQGDTTTVMTVALACFYHRIPIGHVEAGLRTWDMQNPFPEEANRVIAGKLARWHFAPTEGSRQNLLREGVSIRSLRLIAESLAEQAPRSKNPDELLEGVRVALGRMIIQEINGLNEELPVIALDADLEQILLNMIRGQSGVVGLEPGLAERLQNGLAEFTQSQELAGQPAVLLVSPGIRPWLSRFIRRSVPGLHVLSFNEVPDSKQVRLISTLGHQGRLGK